MLTPAPSAVLSVPSSGEIMGRRWQLRLLGGFELSRDGQLLDLPANEGRLVALVALEHHPVSRERLCDQLWPHAEREPAAASLRTALWRLRRRAGEVVDAAGDVVRLAVGVDVDVARTMRIRERLRADPASEDVDAVVAALGADLLPGWYDEWVLIERERLRQHHLQTLERLADDLRLLGLHADAVTAALSAVAIEPLRESAHRSLVSAHLAEGNVMEALRQFAWFRDALARELALAPTRAMTELVDPYLSARRPPRTPRHAEPGVDASKQGGGSAGLTPDMVAYIGRGTESPEQAAGRARAVSGASGARHETEDAHRIRRARRDAAVTPR